MMVLAAAITSTPAAADVINTVSCQVEHDNNGCERVFKAFEGYKIVGVKAACNLEYGSVSDSQLNAVPANTLKVVKQSDHRWLETRGYCYVGNTKITGGKKTIGSINGVDRIHLGCREHDKNGGDCHILAEVHMSKGEGATNTPENLVSYPSSLLSEPPVSGVIIYKHYVNPGRNTNLKKVHVAGNAFTKYVVQFLPKTGTIQDCGTSKGVIVEPGSNLEGDGLNKLYGSSKPSTPISLKACALRRGTGNITIDKIPIQVTYIKNQSERVAPRKSTRPTNKVERAKRNSQGIVDHRK